MQLSHHQIFEAAAHQLFARAKDLRPDESRHIVHDHPGRTRSSRLRLRCANACGQRTRKAVLARLVDQHVHAIRVAVCAIRSLPCLEVHAEATGPRIGMREHFRDRDIEGLIRRVTARDALEPERGAAWRCALHRSLHVDMCKHAMRKHIVELKGVDDVLQRALDERHRRRIARHRIRPKQHVAHAIRPATEHLPTDIIRVIGGRIRLQARTQKSWRADMTVGQCVAELRAHGNQFVVCEQLHDARNHFARQTNGDAIDLVGVTAQQKFAQYAERPLHGRIMHRAIARSVQQSRQLIVEQRVPIKGAERGRR